MQTLPHIATIGDAYHRYFPRAFGIRQADRMHSMYLIGQTGTGKSTLLFNLAMQDARAGHGFCLIDPHGDLAASLSQSLDRPHIYWNMADPNTPYGYNPITRTSELNRPLVASGLIDALKKQWADAWGARMEHLLRYALLALLELPRADLRDVVRIYVESDFRRAVLPNVTDPQVREFWTSEFPKMNYRTAFDGVAPIANKIGAILANPIVRKAVCEPAEPLRFRRIMDDGEILIVNLAKGRIGADSANVLGGLIVSSIMHAGFSRHDQPETMRRPFFLAVDEFHSFTTEAFADLLPEARKYGLSLTLSHQHIAQLEPVVTEAILGNVGTIVAFRLGVTDAAVLARQLGDIAPDALTMLANHHALVQLMVDGRKTRAFSATTRPAIIGGSDIAATSLDLRAA
ncbi:MAG: type IV secretory system conjugative DNA transfer family protein [Novosphingobium sp.]|nr:type IV secretory system conjugative DNA transfer family protein [Novosphingobium sp.]